MIADGLWDVYEKLSHGHDRELVAEKYEISRQEQDESALESHRKADVRAIDRQPWSEQDCSRGNPVEKATRW